MITGFNQEQFEEMTKKMINRGQGKLHRNVYLQKLMNQFIEFIQWAPSRDWSRLFVLKKDQSGPEYQKNLYMEFFNFNLEKQNILHFPQRINCLSQLLMPQKLEIICNSDSLEKKDLIEASFNGDRIVMFLHNYSKLLFYDINPDQTIKKSYEFRLCDEHAESLILQGSSLIVKSKGLYHEFKQNKIAEIISQREQTGENIDLHKWYDYTLTKLQNIIKCGAYDILVYEKHVKIFSYIDPSIKLKEQVVDNEIHQLLISQKFILLDDHSIACLTQPGNKIKIIDVSKDNLVKRDSVSIEFKSPLDQDPISDYQFDLIKFKEPEYAAFLVTSIQGKGQFLQCYNINQEQNELILTYQMPCSDSRILNQIPHLPLVTFDGHKFINCEIYQGKNHLELDLQQDEYEIINQDQENIYSKELEVYRSGFKKYLLKLIEQKEKIKNHEDIQSDQAFYSIEIPEFNTSIFIRKDQANSESEGEKDEENGEIEREKDQANSKILIIQPSLKSIKHIILKQPMLYLAHKVIYRDSSYFVSIILRTKQNDYNECRISFDHSRATLMSFKFMMKIQEAPFFIESHLSNDLTLSILSSNLEDWKEAKDCKFTQYSFDKEKDLWFQQGKTLKLNISNSKDSILTDELTSSIIQRVAQNQTLSFDEPIFKHFQQVMEIHYDIFTNDTKVFAFRNKIIIFSPKTRDYLTIMNNKFDVISTVFLKSKAPLFSITPLINSGVLECSDQFNNKFPFPLFWFSQDSASEDIILKKYAKDPRYPMPIQFGLYDGLISYLDLKSEKLLLFQSEQEQNVGTTSGQIQIFAEKDSSFIDQINSCIERKKNINRLKDKKGNESDNKEKESKNIEDIMKATETNKLLSYNINKRMNLITGTKDHAEKDFIYSELYKRLELSDIQELPMMIYNTSIDSNKYETVLDVLIQNKAIKLVELIVTIALKQDQTGYLYNRLGSYLTMLGANEIQLLLASKNFFFQIPPDYYEEYQIQDDTIIEHNSEYYSFAEINRNMKVIENNMLNIEEPTEKVNEEEKKDIDQPEQEESDEKVKNNEVDDQKQKKLVPIEYYAINLNQLIDSKQQPIEENPIEITKMLIRLVKIDPTILEREPIQIIIDFKWNSYAWGFYLMNLVFFICFIIAFIIDIANVSKNSNVFSNNDSNQRVPRIVSLVFVIYSCGFEYTMKPKYRESLKEGFWHVYNFLLFAVYVTYFAITFAKPEQEYVLKILQLFIVAFSFVKFTYLIRIWTKVSFLVKMLIVVFQELLIFLFFFLVVIGSLTIMAQIIIEDSGDSYKGIKAAAVFVIVLRQSIGDTDTSTIIEGSKDFEILAWLLWLLISIIGNIVFMNFIIAVVSESYEKCMERKTQLIQIAKLQMIQECESLLPPQLFKFKNWFPRFIIIRRQQGTNELGENIDEWQGFIKQIRRQMRQETTNLQNILTQAIKSSTDSNKKELEAVKKDTEKQINDLKLFLSTTYKNQIAANIAEEKEGDQNQNDDI